MTAYSIFHSMVGREITGVKIDGKSYSIDELRAALASTALVERLTNHQKEMVLLNVIADMGGVTDSSDHKWQWLNWFCNDEAHGEHSDTFNRCHEKGWLTTAHNGDFDTCTTSLTDAGRSALSASQSTSREEE